MQVSGITEKDAKAAAQLAQFLQIAIRLVDALKLAGTPISGPGVVEREQNALWLGQLLRDMAASVSTPIASPVPTPKKKTSKAKIGKV